MEGANATEQLNPLLRLNFVTLWVRDQERSRQFFVDQLGFQVIVDVEAAGEGRWIVVAPCAPNWLPGNAGGGLSGIAIVAPPEGSADWQRIGQNTGFSFLSEDVRAVFEEWSKRGVRFALPPMEPEWGSGKARYALFEDRDGNRFSLIEFDEATRAVEAERRIQTTRLEAERRAAQELEIAKQVQARLFPQTLPQLKTLEYAGICIQARAVGGDYYDFLDLGHGSIGLVIADTSGKGIAAALLMANLQANLRSQSAIALDEPQRFLESVNRLFCHNTTDSAYATLFFGQYHDQSRRLRYANCGHYSGVLLRAENTLEELASTGTVLGLFPDWRCGIEERQLCPGDTLALYTDGVSEAFSDSGEEYGVPRLIETLRRKRTLPPRSLLAEIVRDLQGFSSGEQHDDITLIVAMCK